MQKDIYCVFIDYKKTFDRVKHELIMKDLEAVHVDYKDRKIISRQLPYP